MKVQFDVDLDLPPILAEMMQNCQEADELCQECEDKPNADDELTDIVDDALQHLYNSIDLLKQQRNMEAFIQLGMLLERFENIMLERI